MSNEEQNTIIGKLDDLRDDSLALRKTTERALGEIAGRVASLEQWRGTTEATLKRAEDNANYTRDKLDAIDEKVDNARVTLARWGGFGAAALFLMELAAKWL